MKKYPVSTFVYLVGLAVVVISGLMHMAGNHAACESAPFLGAGVMIAGLLFSPAERKLQLT